jgi:hypothetical protein
MKSTIIKLWTCSKQERRYAHATCLAAKLRATDGTGEPEVNAIPFGLKTWLELRLGRAHINRNEDRSCEPPSCVKMNFTSFYDQRRVGELRVQTPSVEEYLNFVAASRRHLHKLSISRRQSSFALTSPSQQPTCLSSFFFFRSRTNPSAVNRTPNDRTKQEDGPLWLTHSTNVNTCSKIRANHMTSAKQMYSAQKIYFQQLQMSVVTSICIPTYLSIFQKENLNICSFVRQCNTFTS